MSETFLHKIIAIKRERVGHQKRGTDMAALTEKALRARRDVPHHAFKKAIARDRVTNIIAEIKLASPSRGTIAERIDLAKIASQYEDGGAAAVSVLTEEEFFKGS